RRNENRKSVELIGRNPFDRLDRCCLPVHTQAKVADCEVRDRVSTRIENVRVDHDPLDPSLLPIGARPILAWKRHCQKEKPDREPRGPRKHAARETSQREGGAHGSSGETRLQADSPADKRARSGTTESTETIRQVYRRFPFQPMLAF